MNTCRYASCAELRFQALLEDEGAAHLRTRHRGHSQGAGGLEQAEVEQEEGDPQVRLLNYTSQVRLRARGKSDPQVIRFLFLQFSKESSPLATNS